MRFLIYHENDESFLFPIFIFFLKVSAAQFLFVHTKRMIRIRRFLAYSVLNLHTQPLWGVLPNKVATDTYAVQVLPKILFFSTLMSYWIWYTENYRLAHNFPYICPSRSLSWLLYLWPTKLRLCLSNEKNDMMKKADL